MRVVGRMLAVGAALVAALVLGAGLLAPTGDEPAVEAKTPEGKNDAAKSGQHKRKKNAERPGKRRTPEARPNIVLVLMDDFSMDLVQTMAQAADMKRDGASYEHSYVVDSLCCVSRASLLTGQYPHQTGVLINTANTPNAYGPVGGWEAFSTYGNLDRSVNVRLQEAGWTTGFIGKYLNQYDLSEGLAVPPGWSDWQAVMANAYDGWDFDMTETLDDGEVVVRHVDAPPEWASEHEKDAAYAGTVIADRAVDFIREHRGRKAPYFLLVAPYATHSRVGHVPYYSSDPGFPPAYRDRATADHPGNCGPVRCRRLDLRDLPGYGDYQADNIPLREDGSPAPQWRPAVPKVTDKGAVHTLRTRAQMAQSIDRLVRRIRAAVGPNTYVVLTSDNGFHIGQHDLDRGKGTPFASDVQVPLLVTGPGVEPGSRREVVSNIDLAATFEDLAGVRPAPYRSGISLVPTFRDPDLDRRRFTYFQHTWARTLAPDPDAMYAGGTMDEIPSYVAVRSRGGLLVRLDLDPDWEEVDEAWEFYDYSRVGWERTNGYGDPRHRREIARLTRRLERFDDCSDLTRDERIPEDCRSITR